MPDIAAEFANPSALGKASKSVSRKAIGSAKYVILGVTSSPGDRWIADANSQGAHIEMRYQYLAGGVNTEHPWRTWNQPAGQFALQYFKESDQLSVIPCMTYYQMYQSLPCGGKGDEAQGNKRNCETAATMKDYLEDMKLLFQKAGEYGKPVVIHHEPDLWGYFSVTQAFAPNDPDKIKVMVRSTRMPEAAEFEDTAAGFGKCIVALRNKYAPNVLLAWHASKWGDPNPHAIAAFLQKCGKWDLVFIDPSDRDSGWKVAHGQSEAQAWWSEKDFVSFRDWGGEIHRETGLSLVAWQIPMGNTILATCDNTEGHYMDNRAEYFLKTTPRTSHRRMGRPRVHRYPLRRRRGGMHRRSRWPGRDGTHESELRSAAIKAKKPRSPTTTVATCASRDESLSPRDRRPIPDLTNSRDRGVKKKLTTSAK